MTQQLPPGQGPIDPRGAFAPPPPPGGMPPGGSPPGGWMPPPPPMFAPPGFYPPRRGGAGKTIFIVILLIGLMVSVLVNFVMLGSDLNASGLVHQQTIVAGNQNQKIAVIPVQGIIMEESAQLFDRFLTQAEKDNDVKAVVIEINTPGGSATASDEMYHRLELFKQRVHNSGRPNLPVIISQRGMATSGGYYVSCGGDYIFAEPATMTGNIGVILPRVNISKLLDKYGVQDVTITDTSGVYKDAGSMLKPETKEEHDYLQGLIDTMFARFKSVVVAGRGNKIVDPGDVYSGKVFMTPDALSRGLIDKEGYPSDAYSYAETTVGQKGMMVIMYQEPPSLFKLLSAESNLPGGKASGQTTVNGVNIDAGSLKNLLTPTPLYLWPGN